MADISVALPDGRSVAFPEGTPRETMEKAMADYWAKSNPPERSTGQRITRGIGLGAQGLTDAAASTLGAPVDLTNLALQQVGIGSDKPIGGAGMFRDAFDFVGSIPSRIAGKPADPRLTPETTGEKIIYGGSKGVGDAVGMLMGTGAVRSLAAPGGVTSKVADALMQQPGLQVAANAAGGSVGEVTGSPLAGLATGVTVGGVSGVARSALAPRLTADQQAAQMLAKTLQRDAKTIPQAQGELEALGSGGMLADVAGRNMQGKVRMIANAPGEGANIAEQALVGRRAGEGSRVENLAASLAGPKRAGATVDDLMEQRSTTAAPLYEKAFASGPVTSDRVQQFLADPIVKQGLNKGMEVQRLEALAKGRPFKPEDYAITGFNEAGDPILSGVPNMRLLDAGKRGLDDILEGYRDTTTGRLALDQRGRAIDQVRKSLLSELDSLNPDYAAARAAWAGPSSAMGAVSQGQSALRGSVDPQQLAKQYAALNDADKEMFRVGAADFIRKTAGEAKPGSQTQRIFGDTRATLNNQAERLKIIFGEDFPKIEQLAKSEAAFNKTLKTLSVSPTKPLADESADLMGQLRVGMRAASGSPTGIVEALMGAGRGLKARVGVGPEAVQSAAARMAFAQTPEEKERALRLLTQALMKGETGKWRGPTSAIAAERLLGSRKQQER